MNILVLNCGSSSLKFQLIATDLERIEQNADQRLAHGQIERIGGAAILNFAVEGGAPEKNGAPVRNISAALDAVIKWISAQSIDGVRNLGDIDAVGHRVVHGGEYFSQSVVITDEVLRANED